MIIRSKIPQPRTNNFFSLIIWPFVKMKALVDEVYEGLLSMIWAELFKHEEKQFSELTHFIAFLVLSIFSMLFYHFEDLEDIVVLSFFALWLIDVYFTKRGLKTNQYERIILEIKDSVVTWKNITPSKRVIKEQFKQAEITQISLSPLTLMGGAFRTVQAHVWRVFIIIKDVDGYLIYEEKNATRAIKKGRDLAQHFNVPLEIAHSEGQGEYAAEKISTFGKTGYSNLWQTTQTATTVKIDKTFSITTVKKVLKSILAEAGVFLFIVIMAGVMVRFGLLLTFLIGPTIGIESPTHVLHISFSGVLSFFAPKIDWISLVAFSFAIMMLISSGWKHSQAHRITIDKKLLRYRIKGQAIAQLSTQNIKQLILLREPKPALLLIEDHGRLLEIDHFEDEEEYEELYYCLLEQLFKSRITNE
jgi:hypothetical protein